MKNKYASYIRFNYRLLPDIWIRVPRWIVGWIMQSSLINLSIDTILGKRVIPTAE